MDNIGMTELCPSCREPLNYPSGDGCAAMTKHCNLAEVVSVEEQEDGSAVITVDYDEQFKDEMASLGLKLLLYCGILQVTPDEVFDMILKGYGNESSL